MKDGESELAGNSGRELDIRAGLGREAGDRDYGESKDHEGQGSSLKEWLEMLGLSQFLQTLQENDVTGEQREGGREGAREGRRELVCALQH